MDTGTNLTLACFHKKEKFSNVYLDGLLCIFVLHGVPRIWITFIPPLSVS